MATQTGYKASELGMIPQDWEIRRIGDFAPLQRGFDLPNSEIQSGDYPVVYSNGIGNYHNCYTVKSPCIATGRSGTLGKVHYVEQDCWVHNTSLWVTKFDNCEPKFIYFLFQKIGFERFASGSGVPTLNRNDAHEFKIALPKSTAEQTAIATALSDTDALISSLQTLIAKKKAIKLSAMQNLLSGKIRLPEFAQRPDGSPKTMRQTELGCVPEDWEVVELGDVGKTYGGLSGKDKSDFDTGNSFYVPFTNVMANIEVDKNQLEKVEVNENQNAVLEGDLLFNGSSEIPEEVCFASLVNFSLPNLYLNSFCFGFRLTKNTIYPKYLAYWFRSEIGRKTITFMAQGSTRYNVSKSEFVKLKLVIPSKPEQTAIAQLLSDMDAEIEALQCRLKKTQSLKQGMMQALLSGKIRLPLE